jgi:antitoxin CptB
MNGLRAHRARLNWQCRRGMRELDILLGGFLEQGYDDLDPAGRRVFEAVLEYPDTLLLEMLMGRLIPADREVAHVVERIRNAAAP